MKNNKILLLMFLVSLMISCNRNQNTNQILAVLKQNKTDTFQFKNKPYIVLMRTFIIKEYDEKDVESILNPFVNNYVHAKENEDSNLQIRFFKESNMTNIHTLSSAEADKTIDRYSNEHDLIFVYDFAKHRLTKFKYKNGQVDAPTDHS